MIPLTASCGGRLHLSREMKNESSGLVLVSPGYPASYTNGLDCEWLLVGPPYSALRARFQVRRLAKYITEGARNSLSKHRY